MVVSAVALAFTSCSDKDEINMKFQTTFTISPKNVLDSYIEVKSGDLDLYVEDDERIRISLFIYNEEGKLISSYPKEELLESYSENCSFNELLPTGKYTIIATSNVVIAKTLNDIQLELWTYSGENELETFALETNPSMSGFAQAALGVYEEEIIVEDGNERIINVQLQPATALAVVKYHNFLDSFIDYENWHNKNYAATGGPNYETNFEFLYTAYSKMAKNGYKEWKYSNDLEMDKLYSYTHLVDVEEWANKFLSWPGITSLEQCRGEYIYGYLALLPGQFSVWCNYDEITSDGRIFAFGFGDGSDSTPKINLEAGKAYRIDLYCDSHEIKCTQISATDRSRVTKSLFKKSNLKLDHRIKFAK